MLKPLVPLLWAALSIPSAMAGVPNPTLEFNVTVPVSTLNNRGKWSKWTTVYANTEGKGNDTIAEGLPRLAAFDRDPDLRLGAAAKAVYVYGDLGQEGSMNQNKVQFRFAGEDLKNTAQGTNKGLVGHAELEMFKAFEGSYAPLWMDFNTDAPSVEQVVVTTAIETDAKSLEDVNVTTWHFVENGELSSRFTWRETTGKWNTTLTYAGALGDETLRSVSQQANAAISPQQGLNAAVVVQVPANTSWVALNVTRGPSMGQILITSKPTIEGYFAETPTLYESHYVPDERLWFRSLDPRVQYNITLGAVTDIHHPGSRIALNCVTFYGGAAVDGSQSGTNVTTSDDGGDKGNGGGKKPNIGAIAGGVVGGVVGAALLAGLAWFLFRRRKQRKEHRERQPKLEIDDAPVVPFGGPGLPPGYGYDEKGKLVPVPPPAEEPLTPRTRARAIDGGAAPDPESETLDPPEYNPAWQGGSGGSAPASSTAVSSSAVEALAAKKA